MNQKHGYTVGVEIEGNNIVRVIDTETGVKNHTVFTTTVDNQRSALFRFYYYDTLLQSWRFLGSTALESVLQARAGEPNFDLYISALNSKKVEIHVSDGKNEISKIIRLDGKIYFHGKPEQHEKYIEDERNLDAPLPHHINRNKRKRKGWYMIIIIICSLVIVAFILNRFSIRSPLSFSHLQSKFKTIEKVLDHRIRMQKIENWLPFQALKKTHHPGEYDDFFRRENQTEEPKDGNISSLQSKESSGAPVKYTQNISAETREVTAGQSTDRYGSLEYDIIWGDTLWKISKRFYGESTLYNELAKKNYITNPHLIIAGETLSLPPKIVHSQRKNIEDEENKK
jgi:LysM repeat protein